MRVGVNATQRVSAQCLLRNTVASWQGSFATPASVPVTAAGLASFDAVLLDDVQPAALSAAALDALGDYVRDEGGGLLLLGGAVSFAAAGFPQTTLDAVVADGRAEVGGDVRALRRLLGSVSS